MWHKLTLRSQIYLILLGLILVTFLSCLVIVWHNYRIEILLHSIIEKDLVAYQNAEKLQTSLGNQKGFVSYFLLDGDPEWLKKLGTHRQVFRERLKDAAAVPQNEEALTILATIEKHYYRYIDLKDQVIFYYKTGDRERGADLHKSVRKLFFSILADCERYKELKTREIKQAGNRSFKEAERLRSIAGVLVIATSLIILLLVWILARRILNPLRLMALESKEVDTKIQPGDEVKALHRNIRELIRDVGQKSTHLEKSRQNLEQSERMALVGKLAAGMAHSIRNPLTSVKMRLFSLERNAHFTSIQKEDFEVIAEEIRHVDTIVQNFLEFSRPPKLNFQPISLSTVIDQALQLLEHRLRSYEADVIIDREKRLPLFNGDPEQLKEVIVNIIINACEAMQHGGEIRITETLQVDGQKHSILCLSIQDNGPGIPDTVRENIFQPFFSTKDEGTGLGLSIAMGIVNQHNGTIECISQPGMGTTFVLSFITENMG